MGWDVQGLRLALKARRMPTHFLNSARENARNEEAGIAPISISIIQNENRRRAACDEPNLSLVSPYAAVEIAVLNGLRDKRRLDGFDVVQVCHGAGDLEGAVVGAG